MDLLIDTHILLWWLLGDPRLDPQASAAVGHPRNRIYVSSASAWEIAIKAALGKLQVPMPVSSWLPGELASNRFTPLPIEIDHALGVEALSRHHADPFDRILIAQAVAEGLTIVTRDVQFALYGVPLMRG